MSLFRACTHLLNTWDYLLSVCILLQGFIGASAVCHLLSALYTCLRAVRMIYMIDFNGWLSTCHNANDPSSFLSGRLGLICTHFTLRVRLSLIINSTIFNFVHDCPAPISLLIPIISPTLSSSILLSLLFFPLPPAFSSFPASLPLVPFFFLPLFRSHSSPTMQPRGYFLTCVQFNNH